MVRRCKIPRDETYKIHPKWVDNRIHHRTRAGDHQADRTASYKQGNRRVASPRFEHGEVVYAADLQQIDREQSSRGN